MTRPELLARISEKEPGRPSLRDSGVEVLKILEGISAGLSEDEILRRTPGLEEEDLRACAAYAAELAPGSRAPELVRMIERRFGAEGRQERIRAGLQALDKLRKSLKLDRETLKWIAQDADVEDY